MKLTQQQLMLIIKHHPDVKHDVAFQISHLILETERRLKAGMFFKDALEDAAEQLKDEDVL